MKSVVCFIRGHKIVQVHEHGRVAREGGILPMVDGLMSYKECIGGEHKACQRCRKIWREETP